MQTLRSLHEEVFVRDETPDFLAKLRSCGFPDASQLESRSLLGADPERKAFGYGRPLLLSFMSRGTRHDVVFRTMRPDRFGHDRRADRVESMLLAYDSFAEIPRHVLPIDVGVIDASGSLVPIPTGEPYLLAEFVKGELYAKDLGAIAAEPCAREIDRARAEVLARYLADLHAERRPPERYVRALRDTIGHGEGIFGLADSYPSDHTIATPARLEAIERLVIRWRWELKARAGRCRRTHGDFHPFNLLFREGTDFSVLDASRGVAGEPADDVTCMAINYLFFALSKNPQEFSGALRDTWNLFWHTYLTRTGDLEILEVVAPFFAWRSLVLASPLWYPAISDALRNRLLTFAERLLEGAPFHPDRIDEVIS